MFYRTLCSYRYLLFASFGEVNIGLGIFHFFFLRVTVRGKGYRGCGGVPIAFNIVTLNGSFALTCILVEDCCNFISLVFDVLHTSHIAFKWSFSCHIYISLHIYVPILGLFLIHIFVNTNPNG